MVLCSAALLLGILLSSSTATRMCCVLLKMMWSATSLEKRDKVPAIVQSNVTYPDATYPSTSDIRQWGVLNNFDSLAYNT